MSAPDSTPNARPPLLPPQAVKVLAIAFAAGLLLFLLVWLKSRHHYDFYKADGADASAGQTSTLPAPLPPDLASGEGNTGINASGLSLPKDGAIAAPRPPARPPTPAPHPPTAPAPSTAPPATAPVISDAVAQSSPAPRYPQEALRRGVGGTVKVLANVAPDGSVAKVEVAEGSGNRDLDRAALDAVRRWQFKPATRNGQPVASEVRVPIVFSPVR